MFNIGDRVVPNNTDTIYHVGEHNIGTIIENSNGYYEIVWDVSGPNTYKFNDYEHMWNVGYDYVELYQGSTSSTISKHHKVIAKIIRLQNKRKELGYAF
jgi:hypothetical protein